MGGRTSLCILLLVLMMVNPGNSDLAKDKEECASQLAGLATCLPFASGQSKAPTQDCCTGLKQVVKDSKKCLCILIKDRNDPGLGLKLNANLSLTLPQTCHAPANLTECPELLHLAPNSPEAKVFTDFANSAASSNSTAPNSTDDTAKGSSGTSAKTANDGGNKSKSSRLVMICGLLLSWFTSLIIS